MTNDKEEMAKRYALVLNNLAEGILHAVSGSEMVRLEYELDVVRKEFFKRFTKEERLEILDLTAREMKI